MIQDSKLKNAYLIIDALNKCQFKLFKLFNLMTTLSHFFVTNRLCPVGIG